MKFTEAEIKVARQLHELNLPWQPQAGQYVYDIKGIIEKPSPFQDGVYFILDIKHFIRRALDVEGIKRSMCWLPQWEDCRRILDGFGISWEQTAKKLEENSAFENETERIMLYQLILEKLNTLVQDKTLAKSE